MQNNQNKEEPWQTSLRLLKEISEKVGFNPETGKLNLGEDEDERRRGPRIDREKS